MDAEEGDVTPFISVEQDVSTCDEGESCLTCAIATVVDGTCFPGVYTYIYRVSDIAGNEVLDYVQVYIAEQV